MKLFFYYLFVLGSVEAFTQDITPAIRIGPNYQSIFFSPRIGRGFNYDLQDSYSGFGLSGEASVAVKNIVWFSSAQLMRYDLLAYRSGSPKRGILWGQEFNISIRIKKWKDMNLLTFGPLVSVMAKKRSRFQHPWRYKILWIWMRHTLD